MMTCQYSALSNTHDIDIEHYVKLAKAERDEYIVTTANALVANLKSLCRSLLQVASSKLSPRH